MLVPSLDLQRDVAAVSPQGEGGLYIISSQSANSFIALIMIISFYIALYTPDGCLEALQTVVPLVNGPFKSFLKPSKLPGEYTACATNM